MTETIIITNSYHTVEVKFYLDHNQVPQAAISIDGALISQTAHTIPDYPSIHHHSYAIWRRYCHSHASNFVIRSGCGLCGCYDYDPSAERSYRKPESVTDHACGCVELVRLLQTFYPNLLTPNEFERAQNLLSNHDIGENKTDDTPDDGSGDKDAKDYAELTAFISTVIDLPKSVRNVLVSDFIKFQDPLATNLAYERIKTDMLNTSSASANIVKAYLLSEAHNDIKVIQLCKAVDKLEAILSSAFFEKHGIKGDLLYKEATFSQLTNQDRSYIDCAEGDSSITAAWLAHVVDEWHACYGFPIVLDIAKAAVIDVRGQWFPWFDRFCANHSIPKEHVTHPVLLNQQIV